MGTSLPAGTQRKLLDLDYPADEVGLDPDTDDTSSWAHMMELWIYAGDHPASTLPWLLVNAAWRRRWLPGSCASTPHVNAATPRDYTAYNPDCLYYNWDHVRGADSGHGKTAWQWVGGDMGFTCGYDNEAAMEAAFAGQTIAIRVSVRLHSPSVHAAHVLFHDHNISSQLQILAELQC